MTHFCDNPRCKLHHVQAEEGQDSITMAKIDKKIGSTSAMLETTTVWRVAVSVPMGNVYIEGWLCEVCAGVIQLINP